MLRPGSGLTAEGRPQVAAEAMAFDITMRFLDYNQPVSIPGPPADARSVKSLFSGN